MAASAEDATVDYPAMTGRSSAEAATPDLNSHFRYGFVTGHKPEKQVA